jgi:hypothetical protein
MDDTLNDADNDCSEFEHGNVEDDDDKTFYTTNRIFYVCQEHIMYV